MVRMYLEGKSVTDIAKSFNTSPKTVQRNFEHAAEQGMLAKIQTNEEMLIEELVPVALQIYKQKLVEERDPYVAKDVIDKMVKIADRMQNKQQHQQRLGLDAYMAQKRFDTKDETNVQEGRSETLIIESTPVSVSESLPAQTSDEDSE